MFRHRRSSSRLLYATRIGVKLRIWEMLIVTRRWRTICDYFSYLLRRMFCFISRVLINVGRLFRQRSLRDLFDNQIEYLPDTVFDSLENLINLWACFCYYYYYCYAISRGMTRFAIISPAPDSSYSTGRDPRYHQSFAHSVFVDASYLFSYIPQEDTQK